MRFTILISLAFFLFSCGNDSKKSRTEKVEPGLKGLSKTELEAGHSYNSLPINYSQETYALYLPKAYKKDEAVKILLFLDPQGIGKVPLDLYKDLADSFNWVLAGSNAVKNGITYPENSQRLTRLIAQLNEDFPLIKEKALCGFSGGAKIALAYAMESPIKKVIYCGAVTKIGNRDSLSLLGFAGTADMNYSDLIAFSLAFQNSKVKNTLIEWKGDHRFPDPEVMKDGFFWLSDQAIPNLEKKGPTLSEEALVKEQGLKSKFYEAFQESKDLGWWDEEINTLHSLKQSDPMYARILGFIGLACYSYTNQSIQKGDSRQAAYILHIYEKATPENPDMKAFKVQLGLK